MELIEASECLERLLGQRQSSAAPETLSWFGRGSDSSSGDGDGEGEEEGADSLTYALKDLFADERELPNLQISASLSLAVNPSGVRAISLEEIL